MARLAKRHVERLLGRYDDEPVAALTHALRLVLERPDAPWPALVAIAPIDESRRQRLLAGDTAALDELAAELNERRGFEG